MGFKTPFRHRGYYYDRETGLYYLQQRYYDPENGRFINADTAVGNTGNSTYNLFVYCANNPINKRDPSGLVGQSVHDYYYGRGFYCVKDYGDWAIFQNRKTGRLKHGVHLPRKRGQRQA